MATVLLQVRVEDTLKDKAALLFDDLGIDISTAVRMFLKRAVIENGIPFSMTLPRQLYSTNRGIMAMLEIGEEAERNGTSTMTLDEINAEIEACRKEKRTKG